MGSINDIVTGLAVVLVGYLIVWGIAEWTTRR